MNNKEEKVLVLGANGFIASHLVDHLTALDYDVRAYDRFSQGVIQFDRSRVSEVITADINDSSILSRSMNDVRYLFHCFSGTTPSSAESNPYSDITDNLLQAVRVFELAAEKNVKKIVFISSGGAVYGSTAEYGEVNEDSHPEPVSPYGICKLAIEHYLAYYKRKYDVDYVVYRLTNPYGPKQVVKHGQGVIPTFIDGILHGKELNIYGDGSMSRDYIFISDAAKMITNSFAQQSPHNTYNIGSGIQTSLTDILRILETATQTKAKTNYIDAPKTFLQKTPVSIDRYKEDFGYIDLIDIADGLRRTLAGK